MSRMRGILLLGSLLLLIVPRGEAQCAMCRTAVEGSAEGRAMAAKLNAGILVLLAAPSAVALMVGVALRRSRKRLQSPPSGEPFLRPADSIECARRVEAWGNTRSKKGSPARSSASS